MALPFRWKKGTLLVDDRAGEARVDPYTKNLTKRLWASEVAIIDCSDIDRVSAEALMAYNSFVVVNATKSMSGRCPSLGPGILNATRVPLVDNCGPEVIEVGEDTYIRVTETGEMYAGEESVATGITQTAETVTANQEDARAGMNVQLKASATNTMKYVEREQNPIFDSVGVSGTRTSLEGHHVLVVVRGHRYEEDLAVLRPYIREYRPVTIGVDDGVDAVLERGYKLDMVVDNIDSVSDKALAYGTEIAVHAYRDGCVPGSERVDEPGADHVVFPCIGTFEGVAMLLTDDKGAKFIVALGTHNTLIGFLDRGRPGMASIFLTRLAVGGKLIDAKGVSQLCRSRISNWQISALLLAGYIVIGAAMASIATGWATFGLVSVQFGDILRWSRSSF